MSQRNDESRGNEPYQPSSSRPDEQPMTSGRSFHPGNPGFPENSQRDSERHFGRGAPEQYGQEHYWHEGPREPQGREHYGRPGWGQRFWGRERLGRDFPEHERHSWDTTRRERFPEYGDEFRGGGYREAAYGGGRSQTYGDWAQQGGSRRAGFSPPPFVEASEPHYFGTGWQGYGGGPSFTGGTYGNANWRSDAPYFDEEAINRDYHERQSAQRPPSSGGGWRAGSEGSRARRYPPGPKGYQRSDERLREDISERLMHAHHIDSSDVSVQVQGGKVILEGTVPERYMKHAIEDIADAAPGVQDVDNRVSVRREDR